MNKDTVRSRIEELGIIPSIRTSSAEDARFAAEAIAEAGIPIVEITMTVPGALGIISKLALGVRGLVVGAGSVFDVETARHCVDAGATFLTSPGLDQHVVQLALKEGILAIPGALSPTEVITAWQAGADLVKIFPCAQVGGPSYIHALKAPFPDVPFVAAGGVNQHTAAEYLVAGATAVDLGTELIPKKAIEQHDRDWIAELARRFLHIIQGARVQVREAHLHAHPGGHTQ